MNISIDALKRELSVPEKEDLIKKTRGRYILTEKEMEVVKTR